MHNGIIVGKGHSAVRNGDVYFTTYLEENFNHLTVESEMPESLKANMTAFLLKHEEKITSWCNGFGTLRGLFETLAGRHPNKTTPWDEDK